MDWRYGQAGASAGDSIEGPWAARWKLSLPLTAIRAQGLWCSVSVSECRFLVLEPQNVNPSPGFGEKDGHWKQGKTFQSKAVFEFYLRFVPALFPPMRGTASIWWLGQGLCIHGSVMCWSSVSRAGVCLLPWDQAWILISSCLRTLIHCWLLKFRCCIMTKYSLNGSNLCSTLFSCRQTAFWGIWAMMRNGVSSLVTKQQARGQRFVTSRQITFRLWGLCPSGVSPSMDQAWSEKSGGAFFLLNLCSVFPLRFPMDFPIA